MATMLLAVQVPTSESIDDVVEQLALSVDDTISVSVHQGVSFELTLVGIERP